MAKQPVATTETKVSLTVRVKEFFQDVRTEMKKVTWPSKEELKTSTSVVLFLLGIVAGIIYAYDWAFQIVVLGIFKLA
jgi:preprotein translocase subunit SecE